VCKTFNFSILNDIVPPLLCEVTQILSLVLFMNRRKRFFEDGRYGGLFYRFSSRSGAFTTSAGAKQRFMLKKGTTLMDMTFYAIAGDTEKRYVTDLWKTTGVNMSQALRDRGCRLETNFEERRRDMGCWVVGTVVL